MPENQNQIDPGTAVPTSTTYSTLRSSASGYARQSVEAFNGAPAPKSNDVIALPLLQESTQTGYRNKKSYPVVCCAVGSFLAEKNTAYDYVLMSNAAAKDGISIPIKSGFRSMDEQIQLYNERRNPAVALEKGAAAEPGTSNHQMGIALDLDVGMHKSDYIAGRLSGAYQWLVKYGAEFGFDHVEGAKANEPWHWTHLQQQIIGIVSFQSATGLTVLTSEVANAVVATDQTGAQRAANKEGYDDTMAYARASTIQGVSRQTAFSERALFSANNSNWVSSRVSQQEAAQAVLDEAPKPFVAGSTNPYTYNFATGLWGDDKSV